MNFDYNCNDLHLISPFTALKRVCKIKISQYLYSVRNLLPYPM